MKIAVAQILFLFLLFLQAKAEDKVQIEVAESNLQQVTDYYSVLTGKNVEFSSEKLKSIKISITTGNTPLPKSKAIKFIESALYIKGFELTAKSNGSFVLSQYASFNEQHSIPTKASLSLEENIRRRVVLPYPEKIQPSGSPNPLSPPASGDR